MCQQLAQCWPGGDICRLWGAICAGAERGPSSSWDRRWHSWGFLNSHWFVSLSLSFATAEKWGRESVGTPATMVVWTLPKAWRQILLIKRNRKLLFVGLHFPGSAACGAGASVQGCSGAGPGPGLLGFPCSASGSCLLLGPVGHRWGCPTVGCVL